MTPSGQKVPVNSEQNRMQLSRAYAANGNPTMTPVMCGFLLQAMAFDKSSDAFKQAQVVAHRVHGDYKDDGMSFDYAIAASMRIRAEQPALFREMATVRCPCCNGACSVVKD